MYSIESFINYVYEDDIDYATEGIVGNTWEGVKKFLKRVKGFFTISIPNFFKRIFAKNPELKKDPEVREAVKEISKSQNEAKHLTTKTEVNIKKSETTSNNNEAKEEQKEEIKNDVSRLKGIIAMVRKATSKINAKARAAAGKAKEKGQQYAGKVKGKYDEMKNRYDEVHGKTPIAGVKS